MKDQKMYDLALCLVFLLMTLLPASATAQQPASMGNLVRQTEEYYQGVRSFSARFHQITTSAVSATMKTEAGGTLYYQKPRQMRWDYDTPEEQLFVANQQLAWLHVPEDRQLSLFNAADLFSSPLAQTFFDGFVELRKNFDFTLESQLSGPDSAVLRLLPKTDDPTIRHLFLWIDLSSYRIYKIETHDAMGNINQISLENQQMNVALESRLFELEIPPSTMVLDMEGRQLSLAEIEALKQKLLK